MGRREREREKGGGGRKRERVTQRWNYFATFRISRRDCALTNLRSLVYRGQGTLSCRQEAESGFSCEV